MAKNIRSALWEHTIRWLDAHGRVATVVAIIVSFGGAALVNRIAAIWANVTGVYLWIVGLLVFCLFMLSFVLVGRAIEKGHSDRALAVAQLDLELAPSQGPSQKMLLSVRNKGKKQKFHATCKLMARRNDPNALFQKVYDLAWESHSYRHATIARDESRNLLVATADIDYRNQLEEVKLIERSVDGEKEPVESSRWIRNEEITPEYDLEISIFGEGDAGPVIERFTLKCGGKTSALEMVQVEQSQGIGDWRNQLPDRGDFERFTSSKRDNPDGSVSSEATVIRQIDRRPQLWDSLAERFKELPSEPMCVWAEWVYTFETKQLQWWVNHPSEVAVKLCIELCKEGGRLLLLEPSFRSKFADIASVSDDGDRWLFGIRKVAGIGKVRAHTLHSVSGGAEGNSEGGEIRDLPGASRLLCQMARNGF